MPSKFAFPTPNGSTGLTVRDYLAIQAMNGLIASRTTALDRDAYDIVAATAYKMADAMLKARGEEQTQEK